MPRGGEGCVKSGKREVEATRKRSGEVKETVEPGL